ncbi:IQ domain-containing protein C isoform X1 [Phycodurus eques]|uniref:IQ domain-containing protein C isoform X1 n=1 Tax=Phycodurus eques TaxID=693459 RepID=UPI002ACDEF3A|nr:IQ domain-containing protein C isoform X1 [Phycodurus eques]
MDRRDWDKTLTLLQAWARGRLVRAELRRAQVDFEEVVKEIDGTLAHLRWRDAIIPTPHFTDTDGPLPRKDPGPDVGACSQNPAVGDAAPLSEGRGGSDRLHTIEAQKDGSGVKQQTRGCLQSSSVLEAGQNLSSDEIFGSTMDSTSIWTSMDSLPHKGTYFICRGGKSTYSVNLMLGSDYKTYLFSNDGTMSDYCHKILPCLDQNTGYITRHILSLYNIFHNHWANLVKSSCQGRRDWKTCQHYQI